MGLISLSSVTIIHAQDDTLLNEEKQFYQKEIERYKTLFQKQTTGIQSDPSIDATYYKLDIAITTTPEYLRGMVLMKALSRQNNLSSILLDLMNTMTVDSVKVGGTLTTFTQYTSSFSVTLDRSYHLGELMTIEIYYRGRPGSSGFGSFEFSSHSGIPWVWSLSEPYGAKDWWPCSDHPSDKADSADIIVTCDSAFKVGSNGKLLSVNYRDSTGTYHWKEQYPIPTYLISVAITNYAQFSNWFKYSPTDSMEVLNYVLPENLSSAMAELPKAVDGLQIFSDLFGLYPFINEKYGHAQFGWGGGMEHQTMTSLGGFSESLVIHELAHQWFGDMITCQTWPDIWLNEGFATYLEVIYREKKYGTSSYWSRINSHMSSARNAVGSIYVTDTTNIGTLFSWNLVYAKGATVLHMLRHVMGDSGFFRAMYNFANDPIYKYGTASTTDFQAICEAEAAEDLDYFFNEWIYGEKYPRYTYSWTSQQRDGSYDVTIGLSQTTGTSNPSYFTMPIDFKIISAGWDTTVTLFNDQQSQTFLFNVSHRPMSVKLDPQGWILCTKDSLKTFSVSPTNRQFGNVHVNFSKRDSVTVYNTGLTTLNISSVISNNSEFTVTPTSAVINPSSNTKYYITFTPASSGNKVGNIFFTHNGSTSPDVVNVSGIGKMSSVSVTAGWNIISLPITVSDPRKEILFPTATSVAFKYTKDAGYDTSDTLYQGWGYWLKFGFNQTINFDGTPPPTDTIDVDTGWNLIGTSILPIAVNAITTIPTGIVCSDYFGYSGSYIIVDSMKPARGYWVKVNQTGKLIVGNSTMVKEEALSDISQQKFNTLTIEDKLGNIQHLFFGKQIEGPRLEKFELPPLPPAGEFDCRFESGRFLEVFNNEAAKDAAILISTENYPLKISWDIKYSDISVSLKIDDRIIPMLTSSSTHISNPRRVESSTISRIYLSLSSQFNLPTEFMVEQNYPNPFNPITTIRYQLPVESRVTIKVYNLLGQEVALLVDEVQDAGYKSIKWNPSNTSGISFKGGYLPAGRHGASGVYFYQIKVFDVDGKIISFTSTKKMILLR
ncbi:MAG: M1 family aminopeptidase [Bacteroidota bacterium]|nr:M1 family aminopeptidase [Bacteroidota bacterium]